MSDKGQTDSHTAQVHTAQPAAQTTDPLVLSLANEHVEREKFRHTFICNIFSIDTPVSDVLLTCNKTHSSTLNRRSATHPLLFSQTSSVASV